MAEYRWNQQEMAAGYDASAEHIHPYYLELQQVLLDLMPCAAETEFLVVDLGGGSGRLAERVLERFSRCRMVVVDQSPAFLDIAVRRTSRFGSRAVFLQSRLQDDWESRLPEPPQVLLSMSAIHHLEPEEKQAFYRRCAGVLTGEGVLLNGDEIRPEADADYLHEVQSWVAHMHRVTEAGLVAPALAEGLQKWEERNLQGFGSPRRSGDDCHETAAMQLQYLRKGGFRTVDLPWQRGLWGVLRGSK